MDRISQLQELFQRVAELQFTSIGVLQQSAPPAVDPNASPEEAQQQTAAIAAFSVQAKL